MYLITAISEPDSKLGIIFNTAFMEMVILVSYAILPTIIEII